MRSKGLESELSFPDVEKELNRGEIIELKSEIFSEAGILFPHSAFKAIFDPDNSAPLIFDHMKKQSMENYLGAVRKLFRLAIESRDIDPKDDKVKIKEFEDFLEGLAVRK